MKKEKKTTKKKTSELDTLRETLHLLPEPSFQRKLGERVNYARWGEVAIQGIEEEGKILWIADQKSEEKRTAYVSWMDLMDLDRSEESFIENKDLKIEYKQKMMSDLLHKAYHYGVDFEPDYQRDYVWEAEDKEMLIDSIFKNVDIGKFAFVVLTDEEWKATEYKTAYEVLDGKQRMRAVLEFVEGRYTYRGKRYQELSEIDQMHIKRYPINVAEITDVNEEQKLRIFVKINTTGKQMSAAHLEKIKKRLGELEGVGVR